MAQPAVPRSVHLTARAAQRVRELVTRRGNGTQPGLRLYVARGGCAGYQYGLRLDPGPQDRDAVFESQGVRVFVDPVSLAYVAGAVVDYVDDWMRSGFVIHNPNAHHTCECGLSFRPADPSAPEPTQHARCACRG